MAIRWSLLVIITVGCSSISLEKHTVTDELHRMLHPCFLHNLHYVKVATMLGANSTSTSDYNLVDFVLKWLVAYENIAISIDSVEQNFLGTGRKPSYHYDWSGNSYFDPNKSETIAANRSNSDKIYSFTPTGASIIIIGDLTTMFEHLQGAVRHPFDNPNEKYVILLWLESYINSSLLSDSSRRLLDHLWLHAGIYRAVVLIVYNGRIQTGFYAKYFNPKAASQIFKANSSQIAFGICEIFAESYPIDFEGYPMKIAAVWRSGLYAPRSFSNIPKTGYFGSINFDVLLFTTLHQVMNLSFRIERVNDYGFRLANNTFTGSFAKVMYGEAAITFNTHFIMNYKTEQIDFLVSLTTDEYCVVAPKGLPIPQTTAVFLWFQSQTWVFLMCVTFGLAICWFHIRKLSAPNRISEDFSLRLLDMCLLILGCPVKKPKTFFYIEKYFLMGCLGLSLILNAVFQGYLTKSYKIVRYREDIQSLMELDKTGLSIVYQSPSVAEIFSDHSDAIASPYHRLQHRMILKRNYTLADLVQFRNSCLLERKSFFQVQKHVHELPSGVFQLHLIPECPKLFSLTYIVRKQWALTEKFNRILGLINASGLSAVWTRWIETARFLRLKMRNRKHKHKDLLRRKPFSYYDIKMAFHIYFVGCLIAFTIFIIEILIYKYIS